MYVNGKQSGILEGNVAYNWDSWIEEPSKSSQTHGVHDAFTLQSYIQQLYNNSNTNRT